MGAEEGKTHHKLRELAAPLQQQLASLATAQSVQAVIGERVDTLRTFRALFFVAALLAKQCGTRAQNYPARGVVAADLHLAVVGISVVVNHPDRVATAERRAENRDQEDLPPRERLRFGVGLAAQRAMMRRHALDDVRAKLLLAKLLEALVERVLTGSSSSSIRPLLKCGQRRRGVQEDRKADEIMQ